MKYSNEEILVEIKKRSRKIIIKRTYRTIEILSGLAGVLFIVLMGIIMYIPKGTMGTSQSSVYGSLLLGTESGGYILVAFVAFVIGMIVTLICLRCKRLKDCAEEDGDCETIDKNLTADKNNK